MPFTCCISLLQHVMAGWQISFPQLSFFFSNKKTGQVLPSRHTVLTGPLHKGKGQEEELPVHPVTLLWHSFNEHARSVLVFNVESGTVQGCRLRQAPHNSLTLSTQCKSKAKRHFLHTGSHQDLIWGNYRLWGSEPPPRKVSQENTGCFSSFFSDFLQCPAWCTNPAKMTAL